MEEKVLTSIYVCSPYRPLSASEDSRNQELEANIRRAKQACRLLAKLGYLPLAPHLYFTQFLDDDNPAERGEGMNLAMEWLDASEEVWVFGEVISEGMAAEIAFAKEQGKPVRMMPEPTGIISMVIAEIESAAKKESEDEENEEQQRNEEG